MCIRVTLILFNVLTEKNYFITYFFAKIDVENKMSPKSLSQNTIKTGIFTALSKICYEFDFTKTESIPENHNTKSKTLSKELLHKRLSVIHQMVANKYYL